jgi:hypothetical protein
MSVVRNGILRAMALTYPAVDTGAVIDDRPGRKGIHPTFDTSVDLQTLTLLITFSW